MVDFHFKGRFLGAELLIDSMAVVFFSSLFGCYVPLAIEFLCGASAFHAAFLV